MNLEKNSEVQNLSNQQHTLENLTDENTQQPVITGGGSVSNKNGKLLISVISGITIIIAISCFMYWNFIENKQVEVAKITETKVPKAQDTTNKLQPPMNTLDPKAQELINQYKELTKSLSDGAKQGNSTDADMNLIDQFSVISDELEKYDTSKIKQAIISAYSYGFDLNITINGKDIGIKGGGSTSSRLFDSSSVMSFISTPDVVAQNFVLHQGINTITIKYKKISKDSSHTLDVKLSSYFNDGQSRQDDTNNVLIAQVKNKTEGTIQSTFDLEPTKPTDFKIVTISE